jgi:phosphoribosylamine--glycine ligase
MAKVLVIGSGGREHALAWKLAQSDKVNEVFIAPGNAGTAIIGTNVPISFTDVEGLLKFAQSRKIDLTVVGQEAASAAGVVDTFEANDLKIFGPSKDATQIESSKAFAKDLMRTEHIPTANYKTFTEESSALEYVSKHSMPIVIKASGLAEGKGVVIAQDLKEAEEAIHNCLAEGIFGISGKTIVIEDFLLGQEI